MSDSVLLQTADPEDFTLEPEDDLDAFNDETFGGEADEWQESAHEELAQLTEQERQALKASNDFFEFGSDDGECLEPATKQNGGLQNNQTLGSLDSPSARGALGSLDSPSARGALPESQNGGLPNKQFSGLSLEPQVQVPLTIQTSLPMNPVVYPAQVLPAPYHQLPPHQVQYNLVPPAHFQAEPLHDPAIMSFSKVPQLPMVHQLPHQYSQVQMPRGNFPGPLPPVLQPSSVPQFPQNLNNVPPTSAPYRTGMYQPTVLGFKTMQDVENEMLFGAGTVNAAAPPSSKPQRQPTGGDNSFSRQQQLQAHAQQQQKGQLLNQQQQQLLSRNLNYPGMRDRQQHQVFNNTNQRANQQHPRSHQDNQRFQDVQRNQAWNQREVHEHRNTQDNIHRNNHYKHQRMHADEEHRYGRHPDEDHRFNRHHEDDLRYNRHESRPQQTRELDEDSWRWNEVRARNRDSATRRDLMPGHVHVLGILRHSRSRHRDPDDDCLGDEAPLINPTGDPLLDAKLSEEQELASRCRYFTETEDEYSGLMSSRDKQFIINIQLSQLKCDNPYVDDYYYTMYTAKKQQTEDPESTGQMLLNESLDHEVEYTPTQFENSLGKLQVVTVKAPRQIIDVGVVRCPEANSPVEERAADPGLTVVKDNKRSQDYKAVLLQIERVYSTLLDLESLKLKLAAIPTGAPLREQVTLDLTRQIQNLVSGLSKPGVIPQYLEVRKGRGLLSRCLNHLPGAAASRVSQAMLVYLGLVCKEKSWVDSIWVHLHRHLAQTSLANLETAMGILPRAKDSILTNILTSSLGVSTLLAVLFRATTAAKRGQEKISVPVWRELILRVISWTSSSRGPKDAGLAAPLVQPQPIDIGFLLTLPTDKMQAWEAFLNEVGLEAKEKA